MRSRLLTGWWARRGTHAAVVAAVAILTAGAFVVTGERGRPALLAPLLVLAAGVVPSAGLALGRARRHEAALLRLHGRTGAGWATALSPEPLLSAALGGAVGASATAVTGADRWDLAALVWAVSTVVVLVAMLVALRGPLSQLLGGQAGVDRVRAGGAAASAVPVLVLVAALVALLRGVGGGASGGVGGGPDAVAYAAPAVVGLAAGLLLVQAVRLVARWLSGRPDLAAALAGRRLSLARTSIGVPLLVGSAVLLGLGVNTVLSVRDWETDTRRVTAAAPLVVPYDGSADAVLAATREADPEGRWLMAAVQVFEDERPESRRVYVDAARYERVVGDRLADTDAAAGSAAVARLASAAAETPPEPVTTGQRLVASVSLEGDRRRPVRLDVLTSGVSGSGRQTLFARLTPGVPVVLSRELSRCEPGCRVTGLEVQVGLECSARIWARAVCRRQALEITRLDLGGLDLLERAWTLAEPDERPPGEVEAAAGRLHVRPSTAGTSYLTTDRSAWAAPLLATDRVDWPDGPEAPTPGGLARPSRVLRTVPALPLVGAAGTVLDLPSSLVDGGRTVAAGDALVLARADTPASVLDRVGTPVRGASLAEPAVSASRSAALASQVTAIAAGGTLLGLIGILLPTGRLRAEQARERAVLRLVGVPADVHRRTGRLQAVIVASAATLGAVAGTLLVTAVFGDVLPLLTTDAAQLPLDTRPRAAAVALAGAVALLISTAAAWWAGHLPESATRPASLREEVSG